MTYEKGAMIQRIIIVCALGYIAGKIANISDYVKEIRDEVRQHIAVTENEARNG